MDITKRLLELDPTLARFNEGHWDKPFDPEAVGYSSFNDAGIEVETGEFLYAFVRMLKPDVVLETGTHWGIGASYMGMALKDNHHGGLDTFEFLPEIFEKAKERINKLGLNEIVNCHLMDVKDFHPAADYKLILLDTEPQTRFAELEKFYPNLEERGFVFIHDLHSNMHQVDNPEHGFAWPYGPVTDWIKYAVSNDLLRPFHFETPRGLTGFYKPSKDDYKWK